MRVHTHTPLVGGAWWVKCLCYKYEDLSSDPEKPGMGAHTCSPSAGRQKQESQSFGDSQYSQMTELQVVPNSVSRNKAESVR